jgi:hypothetical protein
MYRYSGHFLRLIYILRFGVVLISIILEIIFICTLWVLRRKLSGKAIGRI